MKKILGSLALALLLTGCGGGGGNDTSSGGDTTDDALTQFAIRDIQYFIGDENYQPSQAEIDCVRALPDEPNIDVHGQQVIDCVNNN